MADRTPAKIIIVDDANLMRSMLRSFLTNEGYEVIGMYSSGRGLMDAVAKLKPDIICLDYNLPEVDGLELLKEIHGAHPAVAVVMITGNESPDLEIAAVEAGSSGFIHKPFTQKSITRELRQVELAQRLLLRTLQAEGVPTGEAVRARVVIADDSLAMRKLLAAILVQGNIEIAGEACDGKQAIELVKKHRPDFVCLDIEMPVMSGLEALAEIHSQHPEIKALMVTASADRDDIMRAVKMGAKGYLLKPFQPSEILDEVTKLLG